MALFLERFLPLSVQKWCTGPEARGGLRACHLPYIGRAYARVTHAEPSRAPRSAGALGPDGTLAGGPPLALGRVQGPAEGPEPFGGPLGLLFVRGLPGRPLAGLLWPFPLYLPFLSILPFCRFC